MPRKPRRLLDTGYYHIVLKGSGNQILFESEWDYRKFLSYLYEFAARHKLQLIAWCLMSNHVHLVVLDTAQALSSCIHDLATAYAVHFNRYNGHSGPVFDGRFHSVLIESDEQFLSAVRYVHDNPQRASICSASDYPWSSYGEYLHPESSLVKTDVLFDLIGGKERYEAFLSDDSYGTYVFRGTSRLKDEDAIIVAKQLLGSDELSKLRSLPTEHRAHGLQLLRDAGLTLKQVERVTGIGRGIISRYTHA